MDRDALKKDIDEILIVSSNEVEGNEVTDPLNDEIEVISDSDLEKRKLSKQYTDALQVLLNPDAPSFHVILAEQEVRQSLNEDDLQPQNIEPAAEEPKVEAEPELKKQAEGGDNDDESKDCENLMKVKSSIAIYRSKLKVDQGLIGVEFTPSSGTPANIETPVNVDITSSVSAASKPINCTPASSNIQFRHEIFDQNATFTMQPEIDHTLPTEPMLFGLSQPCCENLPPKICDCFSKFEKRKKEFEELMTKVTDAIEKIERESQIDASLDINSVVDLIENHLEDELVKTIEPTEDMNVKSISEMVIKKIKSTVRFMDDEKEERECQCEKRKLEKLAKENHVRLPITSMMKKALFGEVPEKELEIIREKLSLENESSKAQDIEIPKTDEVESLKIPVDESTKANEDQSSKKLEEILSPLKLVEEELNKSCPCISNTCESAAQTSDILLKNSFIKQKIKQFENLSAKSSRELSAIRSQNSVLVMNFTLGELKKVQPEEDLSNPKFVMLSNDIEELPQKLQVISSKRSVMEREMQEDKEMNEVYHKVLMMDDDDGYGERAPKYSEDLVDDDGFEDLPKVPSNGVNQVASCAYLDENITFPVDENEEKINKIERLPLSIPQPSSHAVNDQFIGISPSTSEDSSAAKEKRMSRLRQCKCFMKRISRSFLGKK